MENTSKIHFFIFSTYKTIINFLFPRTCPNCNKVIENKKLFCDHCFKNMSFISSCVCQWCGRPLYSEFTGEKILCGKCMAKRPTYDMARSVFIYETSSKDSILKFKYADKMEFGKTFVSLMLQAGTPLLQKTDIIMAVPMHWSRRLMRKYNQAEILAKTLGKKTKIPYNPRVLIRTKYTTRQENKNYTERQANVKNVFSVKNKERIKGKRILLIDDVFTTGATVSNCAKTLKKSGAKAVYVLTIAKTIKQ